MSNKITVTLFFDTRRELADSTYPVKLTVYCDGEKRRYSTGITLTAADWTKINGDKLRDDRLKAIKRALHAKLEYAEQVVQNTQPFSFDDFSDNFFGRAEKRKRELEKLQNCLKTAFDKQISSLVKDGRVSSADVYQTACNSFVRFRPGAKLSDVTRNFLEEYERFMREVGSSPSTTGIYLRHLRAVLNSAIREGILKQENYPFRGYAIPSGRNIKKALSIDDIKRLISYQPQTERQALRLTTGCCPTTVVG